MLRVDGLPEMFNCSRALMYDFALEHCPRLQISMTFFMNVVLATTYILKLII